MDSSIESLLSHLKEAIKETKGVAAKDKKNSDPFGSMNFVVCGKIGKTLKIYPVMNG